MNILLLGPLTSLLASLILFAVAWGNYAIYRTATDRMAALSSWRFRPITWQPLMTAYEAVPFNKHLRARLLCRDAWKLYDPIVLEAIKNPVTEFPVMMPGEPVEAPPAVH